MKKTIVLVWRISSWKDYAGDFLELNFWGKHLGISSVLRIAAKDRWVEETRENLIDIWRELTEKYWDWYLAKLLITREASDLLIISWCRQLWQLEYLRNNTDCYIIWIESREEIRYQRMLERWKIGENISFEQFCLLEEQEEKIVQKVGECLKLCDAIVENNGKIDEFEEKLLKLLRNRS